MLTTPCRICKGIRQGQVGRFSGSSFFTKFVNMCWNWFLYWTILLSSLLSSLFYFISCSCFSSVIQLSRIYFFVDFCFLYIPTSLYSYIIFLLFCFFFPYKYTWASIVVFLLDKYLKSAHIPSDILTIKSTIVNHLEAGSKFDLSKKRR